MLRVLFVAALAAMLAAPSVALAGTTGGNAKTQGDFSLSHRFSLEIDGVLVAGIRDIDSPDIADVLREYNKSHKLFASSKPGKMVVTRDWSSTSDWHKWSQAGQSQRKSISIVFHNDAGESLRLNFFECWPSKWQGPALNAKSSAHATETLEIHFERIELK